jgi:hypothetical protein
MRTYTTLDDPLATFGTYTVAAGINDNGQIVGALGEPEKGAASRLTAPLFLLHHASLSRTRSTVAACHLPPAGVATLRRFSSSAAFRADRPASSTNSGRSCSARSRAACRSAMPFAFRPPNLTPRFFTLLVGVRPSQLARARRARSRAPLGLATIIALWNSIRLAPCHCDWRR